MNMSSYDCCGNTAASEGVESLAALLKIISESNRLRILCVLDASTELCVCELMRHIPDMSQSLLSHHLADLKGADLVESDKRGAKVYYRLTGTGERVTHTVLSLTKKEMTV